MDEILKEKLDEIVARLGNSHNTINVLGCVEVNEVKKLLTLLEYGIIKTLKGSMSMELDRTVNDIKYVFDAIQYTTIEQVNVVNQILNTCNEVLDLEKEYIDANFDYFFGEGDDTPIKTGNLDNIENTDIEWNQLQENLQPIQEPQVTDMSETKQPIMSDVHTSEPTVQQIDFVTAHIAPTEIKNTQAPIEAEDVQASMETKDVQEPLNVNVVELEKFTPEDLNKETLTDLLKNSHTEPTEGLKNINLTELQEKLDQPVIEKPVNVVKQVKISLDELEKPLEQPVKKKRGRPSKKLKK